MADVGEKLGLQPSSILQLAILLVELVPQSKFLKPRLREIKRNADTDRGGDKRKKPPKPSSGMDPGASKSGSVMQASR